MKTVYTQAVLDRFSAIEALAKKKSDLYRKYYDLLILIEERTELMLLTAFDESKKSVMSKIYLLESIFSKQMIKKYLAETKDIPFEPRFKYSTVGITRFKEFTFSVEMRNWFNKSGLDNIINEVSFINPDPFNEAISNGLFDSYNTGGNTVFSTFDLGIDFALRDKNVEKFFRDYSMKLSEQVSKSIQSSIKSELAQAIKNGDSIPDVRKNILNLWNNPIDVVVPPKLSADGSIIRQGYSYQMAPKHWATTVARTEINGAYNKGRLDGFKQTGVVDRVQFSTSPDERLCPICAILEGVIYTLEQADNVIPQHANCRCQWIPLLKGEDFGEAKEQALENVQNLETLEQYLINVEGRHPDTALKYENELKDVLGIPKEQKIYWKEIEKAFSVGDEFDVQLNFTTYGNNFDISGRILAKKDYKNLKYYSQKAEKELVANYTKGQRIGSFRREFSINEYAYDAAAKKMKTELGVYHASFFLDEAFQGAKIGKNLFRNQLEFYTKYNVSNISVNANGDVGLYAWAKYGFDFNLSTTANSAKRSLANYVAVHSGGEKWSFEHFKHSWDFATFKKTFKNGKTITGKEFMLHNFSSWNGILDLSKNSLSRQILEQYLGIK